MPSDNYTLEAAQLLEDAVDYMDVHGWRQHLYWDDDGAACAIGSLTMARLHGDLEAARLEGSCYEDMTEGHFAQSAAHIALYKYVRANLVDTFMAGVEDWNDQDDQAYADVRDAMLATAKELRNDTR